MQHVISTHKIHLTRNDSYATGASIVTRVMSKFIAWCNMQEKNWFFWLAVSVLGGIGTVLPLTLMVVVFAGNNSLPLWTLASIINVPILVVNLAVQPAKVKLPVLFFAWIGNAIIIAYSLVLFFMK